MGSLYGALRVVLAKVPKWIFSQKKKWIVTDQEISLAFEQDRKDAMAVLYDRYSSPLYGVILRICRDDAMAQDALQNTFVKIWRHRSSFDPTKAKLFTWMYTIARRAALDAVTRGEQNRTEDVLELRDLVADSVIPIDTLDVHSKLSRIEPKYREVIEALFFEGYSQREWSEQSGLPLGTVKSRLRIGLRELRKNFIEKIVYTFILLNLIGL